MRVILTAIGSITGDLIAPLTPILEVAFDAAVETTAAVQVPASACSRSRNQYLSTALLDMLARQKQPDWDRLLGIADVDLYVPGLNFVFGEADARRGIAVFSLARLHTPDRARFIRRAATEAIHELGHTFGMTHCENPACVMWFSNSLAETDRKGAQFCARHVQTLQKMLADSD